MSTCFHLDTSQDFDSGPTLDEIDNAITDRNTWAWMSAVNCVAFEAEYLGRWGEGSWAGCECHEHLNARVCLGKPAQALQNLPQKQRQVRERPETRHCWRRGCRAVELASGDALRDQLRVMASHATSLLSHLTGATDQAGLLRDWQRARAALWTSMLVKLRYWDELPWKLCALAHENVHVVQKTAQRVLMLYDNAANTETPGPGCLHRMTRRCCQKDYNGGDDDPGLRPLIERLASGEHYADFSTDERQPIAKWLSAFRHVSWHCGMMVWPSIDNRKST
eukprot:s5886_g2.t1